MGTSLARRCALRETKRLPLKRAVELSTLFGFWFLVSRFHPNRDRYRDRYRDRLFNHGTHGTHGKAWLCFRVVSVFRGSNQKLRSTPNRCGADLNGSQCLQAFAQNPHAQLPFLGLLVFWLDPSNRLNTCPSVIQKTPAAHRTAGVHLLPLTYYLLLRSETDTRLDALFADLLLIRPDQLAGAQVFERHRELVVLVHCASDLRLDFA